ncbi:MAG: hypothetical protein M3209_18695 [Acidobacteriota bacterium]|nr:hypothetical protein [Acidobacteriota bacterium]
MALDLKRELFRHLVATLAFRAKIAVLGAPLDFEAFKINETIRTPGEILAHMGDLLEGSLYLMKGELVVLNSVPLPWKDEVRRFFSAVEEFDSYLASEATLNQSIEKITQGPITDALTHVGQIVLMRRAAGSPVQVESYFTAEIIPGKTDREFFRMSSED